MPTFEKYQAPEDPQISLFDEADLDAPEDDEVIDLESSDQPPPKKRRNRGKRQPLPDYLPVVRVEHQLSDVELLGPNGEQYTKIGEDISKQLDVVPATVQVIEHARFKYAVKGQEELGVKIAPITGQPLNKSIASAGLLAHVAQSKYQYHLPLYRQQQIWSSLEVTLPRNSLSRWMVQIGELLQPLVDYQFDQMKMHPHIHVDETPVTVLSDNNQKPDSPSHQGYIWVYTNRNGGSI